MEGAGGRCARPVLDAYGELPHQPPDQARRRPAAANAVHDVDGNEDERDRTVSVFNGPAPEIHSCDTQAEEIAAVAAWINRAVADGIVPSEIGLFVRSREQLARARATVETAGLRWLELSEREQDAESHVLVGTMYLAKGLEFKAACVTACCSCAHGWKRRPPRPSSTRSTRRSGTCCMSPAPGRGIGC